MKAEWQTKTLADVCQIKPPKAEARKRLSGKQLVSFVPMENLGIHQKILVPAQTRTLDEVAGSYTYFADGDVLLAKITPCFENGKLGIAEKLANGIGFGSSEYIVFRPSPAIDKEWLYYFLSLESFRTEGAERMSGAVGHKRVSKEFVESYPIPVPPRPEQHRIVAILDEAFDGIATAKANAEKNLQNARALFESHLQSVFTERGEGWVDTTLGAQIDLLVGFAFKSAQYSDGEDDIFLLRGDNIVQGSLRWDDVKRWPRSDTAAYERYWLREGDVVLAMDRPWVKAGLKHATITAEDLPCLLVQRTACLRCKPNLDSRFLLYLIRSAAFIHHILGVQTGIGVPHISGQQIKDFAYASPPAADQERIAAKLDALSGEIRNLESLYQQKLTALDDLKKSLLHQAFSGQL
ncbi:MAG: restriction endonuclease subunit S [Rhodocyclaceae bacterium]|nr:restriction endonuclease subunit S [Rhodocyclaceae bacterium]